MKNLKNRLLKIADNTNRSSEEILTYHLLESVLRRVANSIYVNELVLRGGMLTRLWIPPEKRTAEDIDFLGLYAFDIESTKEKFINIFSNQNTNQNTNFTDKVIFDIDSLQVTGIWLETEYPGVRININGNLEDYQKNIQIDVGFGDPMVPPPEWIDYPMLITDNSGKYNQYKLQAVTPETMFGWKLHGLVEQGIKRWRPKDLYDLLLFTLYIELDEILVKKSIVTAFNSRNTTFEEIYYILSTSEWWDRSKNRGKWKWYLRRKPEQNIEEDFLSIVAIVKKRWEKTVKEILDSGTTTGTHFH
ncbi:MAG: nucleotidyl transferase AbiEii/AbiGii toxin family protein [Cyanobacteriota bacterium]|nr:nucleotidyl transferase AbiEii/AbiGii toxin family protein [Cyanobacteriota bacterium]